MGKLVSYFQNLNLKRVILIFSTIGILIYANSLFNPFFGDDNNQIKNNPSIHSILNIPSLFFQGTFPDVIGNQRNNYYKPLLSSIYAMIYLFSGTNPFGYHLIQILIHIINGVLIYLIYTHSFTKKMSFLLALLFLIHPFNSESVIHISALQEPLFAIFGLTALYLLISEYKRNITYSTPLLIMLLSIRSFCLFKTSCW